MVVVDYFKYLGIFVSNNFEWGMHIDDFEQENCIFNFLQTNNGVCVRGLGPIFC